MRSVKGITNLVTLKPRVAPSEIKSKIEDALKHLFDQEYRGRRGSFASLGGFIAADWEVINYVKHKARALIFSASIPPSSAAARPKFHSPQPML